jgi:hypothetical protein
MSHAPAASSAAMAQMPSDKVVGAAAALSESDDLLCEGLGVNIKYAL